MPPSSQKRSSQKRSEKKKQKQKPRPRTSLTATQLKHMIRECPDFPKPGILFYDITTLLKDKVGFAALIDKFFSRVVMS